MIDSKTLSIDWINEVSAKNRNADKILVEKVIRALLLQKFRYSNPIPLPYIKKPFNCAN
ncbi:MAG: hypothetical protein HOK35_19475 [Cytophagia bacterium]|jgi:hypothetical protein|nr:hypothetical protein [Cytophagia bacterium]